MCDIWLLPMAAFFQLWARASNSHQMAVWIFTAVLIQSTHAWIYFGYNGQMGIALLIGLGDLPITNWLVRIFLFLPSRLSPWLFLVCSGYRPPLASRSLVTWRKNAFCWPSGSSLCIIFLVVGYFSKHSQWNRSAIIVLLLCLSFLFLGSPFPLWVSAVSCKRCHIEIVLTVCVLLRMLWTIFRACPDWDPNWNS